MIFNVSRRAARLSSEHGNDYDVPTSGMEDKRLKVHWDNAQRDAFVQNLEYRRISDIQRVADSHTNPEYLCEMIVDLITDSVKKTFPMKNTRRFNQSL